MGRGWGRGGRGPATSSGDARDISWAARSWQCPSAASRWPRSCCCAPAASAAAASEAAAADSASTLRCVYVPRQWKRCQQPRRLPPPRDAEAPKLCTQPCNYWISELEGKCQSAPGAYIHHIYYNKHIHTLAKSTHRRRLTTPRWAESSARRLRSTSAAAAAPPVARWGAAVSPARILSTCPCGHGSALPPLLSTTSCI